MGLFNHKKSNGIVTINILHRRPHYPEDTKFLNSYKVKNDSELDLKTLFYEAFTKAHPDRSILEIRLENDE
jgi:hypothetical protein